MVRNLATDTQGVVPVAALGVHEFRAEVTALLRRSREEGDFPVQFVGAHRRIEGVFLSPARYGALAEAERIVEDLGLVASVEARDDDRYEQGTTADFVLAAETREP